MVETVSPAGGARQRPAVVTAAAWLLYLVAALVVISAVVSLTQLSTVADATRKAYESVPEYGSNVANTVATIAKAGGIVSAIVYLLIAVGLVVLARLDLAGNHVARILSWVFGGLGVVCCSCGSLGNTFANFTTGFGAGAIGGNATDAQRVQDQIRAATPGWYRPTTITIGLVSALVFLVVIILLALPASNRYFRKEQPAAWPVTGQPGYPGYPQAQGYPQPGQQYQWPGGPTAPGGQPGQTWPGGQGGQTWPGQGGAPGGEQRPGDQSNG